MNGGIILYSNGIILPYRRMWDTLFILKGERWAFPAGWRKIGKKGLCTGHKNNKIKEQRSFFFGLHILDTTWD